MRGPKYYIEVPISGKNIDALTLVIKTEKMLKEAKKSEGAMIIDTDTFQKGDNSSYKFDYKVNSSTVGGGSSRGSVFLRGLRSETGYDSYKFVLEKNVDFAKLDTALILGAIEHAFKINQASASEEQEGSSEKRFSARGSKKNKQADNGNQ